MSEDDFSSLGFRLAEAPPRIPLARCQVTVDKAAAGSDCIRLFKGGGCGIVVLTLLMLCSNYHYDHYDHYDYYQEARTYGGLGCCSSR